MFCKKCGASLSDDARFCDKCGAAIAESAVAEDNSVARAGTNDVSIETIDLARLGEANTLIDNVYDKINRAVDKYESKKIILSLKSAVICSALISFTFFIIFTVVVMMFLRLDQDAFTPLCLILPWVVFVVLLVLRFMYLKKLKANADNTIKEAMDLFSANEDLINVYPVDYQYPLAADYIYKMIETRRAPTMNKVLDKCDEYIHQQKMEKLQMMISATIISEDK